MRDKTWKALSLALLIVTVMTGVQHVGFARLVGNSTSNNSGGSTPDAVCWYGNAGKSSSGDVTGSELCVDYQGNLIPTATGSQTLGSSALHFSQVYADAVTVSGAQSATGSVTAGAVGTTPIANTGGTAATQSAILGLNVQVPANVFGLVASSMVPVNASLILVGANAATVTLTSKPEISTTTVIGGSTLLPFGTYLIIQSTAPSQNVVFTSSTAANASGLVLGAATRTITNNKILTLVLDNITVPAVWREVSFGNN